MIDLFFLVIFKLLYPDKNKPHRSNDEMNTAAAFFYGTSFQDKGKVLGNTQPETINEPGSDDPWERLDW